MLKTTLLSLRILAEGYSFLISLAFFHSLVSASRYHDLSCCSQSGIVPRDPNVFLKIKLQLYTKPSNGTYIYVMRCAALLHSQPRGCQGFGCVLECVALELVWFFGWIYFHILLYPFNSFILLPKFLIFWD
jgi:hypothetical protein